MDADPRARARLGVHSTAGRSRVASGAVRWFNDPNGYGSIVPDQGGKDILLHRGSIVGDWRPTTLMPGTRVDFERGQGRMGPEAIKVSCAGADRPRTNPNG